MALAVVSVAVGVSASSPAWAQAGGDGRNDGGSAVYPIAVDAVARPALSALRIADRITVDGRLDERIWFAADSAYEFITNLPRDGYPATERTVVRVIYDEVNIYVGAFMYDSQPSSLFSPGLQQDFSTSDSDLFSVAFDPFLDRQNSIMFGVNPAGAVFDAQSFNDSREVNVAWEGVIDVATQVHGNGWSLEIAVPLRTLRFPPGQAEQVWGMNFGRRVRRANEDSYWAPLARQFRVHKMSRAGSLTGLQGLRQGRNLSVKPWVSAARQTGTARETVGDAGSSFDGGFDVKYGVSSRLTLDVTALTDFSQVEVDQEQVNLTRFSLFFPEKRDFFLENDGIFTLGDVTERNFRTGSSSRDFKLFYSRAIGLSADRRPIPILGGVRLSGRAGRTEIGFLDMQTRRGDGGPAENFLVGRVRHQLGSAGDVGALFTNRQATGDSAGGAWSRSIGIDANFHPLRYMIVNAYAARTDEPDATGDRTAGYVQVGWRDRVWDTSAFVKHVGEAFEPDVGFVRRRGMRQAFATFGAHPQPRVTKLQELNPYIDASFIENVETGRLETRVITPGVIATFVDGGILSFEWEDSFERLIGPTPIAGVEVAPGDYRFATTSLNYASSGARMLGGSLGFTRGSFYDGDRTSVTGRLNLRPSPHFTFELFGQRNALTLAGQSFNADAIGARIRVAASTRLFASAFTQYVESTDELLANVRLNYMHAPLSDIFLVFTERRDMRTDAPIERVLTLKATRLLAF